MLHFVNVIDKTIWIYLLLFFFYKNVNYDPDQDNVDEDEWIKDWMSKSQFTPDAEDHISNTPPS